MVFRIGASRFIVIGKFTVIWVETGVGGGKKLHLLRNSSRTTVLPANLPGTGTVPDTNTFSLFKKYNS